MAPDEPRPQDRIVLAAIACMARDGIDALTVRSIAAEAGVNVAAINYYFRSKDKLIRTVLERTMHQAFVEPLNDLDQLLTANEDPIDALRKLLSEFMADAVDYPRLAFAHLRAILADQDYEHPVTDRITQLLTGLHERIAPALRADGDDERRTSLAQLWSIVLFHSMLPDLFGPFTGIDLRDPDQRELYVARLVDSFVTGGDGSG